MRIPERIAHLVVHRPGILWSVFAVLVAISGALIFWRAKLNSDVLDMMPAEFESVQIYKLADREFSAARDLIFGLITPPAQEEDGSLDAFALHFTTELRKEPWVSRARDKASMGDERDLAELKLLIPPSILNENEEDFAKTIAALQPDAIRARLAEIRGKLPAGGGRAAMDSSLDLLGVVIPAMKWLNLEPGGGDDPGFRVIFVHCHQPDLNEPACNATMAQVEDFKNRVVASWPADRGPAPQILCTGRTAYVSEMAGKLKSDINSTIVGSILLVAVTFYAGFRRWKPLRAIVDALLFSCLLAVACGTVLFGSLNMITIGLCALLVGLGVDLAMVLYAFYVDERNRGHTHEQSIAGAVRTHGPGIWFGAMTTAAAFLCLLLSGSPGYAQLGVLIACGILITALVMMTILWILFDIPRWVYLCLGTAAWLTFDIVSGNWRWHLWQNALVILAAVILAILPYRTFRQILIFLGVVVLIGLLSTMGSWTTYIWQNVIAGVVATVVAVAMVIGFGKLTEKLPALLFSRPWSLLGVSLPVLLVMTVGALIPVGRVAFDINPKTLEPKPSNAGDALRTIMSHLNPGGMDSVMAVIGAPDADALAGAWERADRAWRKLTPDGAPKGAEPLFTSVDTPAGVATSPARIHANAQKLAALDFTKIKAAFEESLEPNGYNPDGPPIVDARNVIHSLADAAAGRKDFAEWRKDLPSTSAWWFLIDNKVSLERPLGIARLKPTHEITTPAQAEKIRQALQVPGVQVGLSGWGFTLAELKPWSEQKMLTLTALMIGLNIIILAMALKAWRPVAIIMVGLAFSVAGLFTTLKLTGLSLNLFNILAFPLVLGVGVDYSIYATLAVRSHDPQRELSALMKPLLLSGLTTVIGFVTLAWSYNPALRGLGLLCGIGVGWCLLTAFVFVLPACALLARKKNASATASEAETSGEQVGSKQ